MFAQEDGSDAFIRHTDSTSDAPRLSDHSSSLSLQRLLRFSRRLNEYWDNFLFPGV
jgi:hypothetical protein